MADEVPQEFSTSVTILVDSESPGENHVATDEVAEKSRSSSVAWSNRASITSLQRTREKFRSLKRRTSVENFGQFGFLVPALALFPQADGVSCYFTLALRLFLTFKTRKNLQSDRITRSSCILHDRC